MQLKSSLVLAIVLVAAVALLFGASISYWHALSKVRAEMEAAIVVGARVAANAVDDAEESADPARRLHLLVADFNGDRHLRAKWLDSAGRVIVESKPAKPDRAAPDWFHGLIRQPEEEVRVALPQAFDGLGSFVLRTDSRNEIGEVWDEIWNTLLIVGVLCGLTLGSLYWLVGRALGPLDQLAKALDQVCESKTVPHIPETGPAEFVQVYRGFNAMAERLSRTEANNRRLTEQLETVQEEERADLARDLHDEIGPFLFSVDVDATAIARALESGKHAEIRQYVATIRESVGHMQRHVKDLLGRLRSAALVDVSLLDAVDNLVGFWQARYPDVDFEVSAPDHSLGDKLDQTIFRIVQESLSNALRHGRPDRVEIEINLASQGVSIEVRDDGCGFSGSGNVPGYGIAGMRERVLALDGTLSVRDASDKSEHSGVVVSAWLPIVSKSSSCSSELNESQERTMIHEQA
jgi:two-component system, NarL family, sensor histidine kinase UhpB